MKLRVAALRYRSKTYLLVMKLWFVVSASKSSRKCSVEGTKPIITITLSRLRVVSASIRATPQRRAIGRNAERLAAKKTAARSVGTNLSLIHHHLSVLLKSEGKSILSQVSVSCSLIKTMTRMMLNKWLLGRGGKLLFKLLLLSIKVSSPLVELKSTTSLVNHRQ